MGAETTKNGMTREDAQALYGKEMYSEKKKYKVEVPQGNSCRFYSDMSFQEPIQDESLVKVTPIMQLMNDGKKADYKFTFPHVFSAKMQFNSIDEATCDFLTAFIRMVQPKVLVETGTHKGRSTRAICDGISRNGVGHLWTVDRTMTELLESGALPESYGEIVTQVIGSSPEILREKMMGIVHDIDFAFLDSVHTYDGVKQELEWILERRAKECYVLVDNARDSGWPGIKELFKEWNDYSHINIANMTGLEIIHMK